LGICAAGALLNLALPGSSGEGKSFRVRCQDRDELARIFTEHNAARNGISNEVLEAHTEPLLAGPAGERWDLILSNIPAKAGQPVLEDFIRRSAAVLNKDGMAFLVAVYTLTGFFRSEISDAGARLLAEETGNEHTVFVYTAGSEDGPGNYPGNEALVFDENFLRSYPFYKRMQGQYKMEDLAYSLDTVHGAPDFDMPGGAIQAGAKLAMKIDLASRLNDASKSREAAFLIHDAGQGHFALWLANCLNNEAAKFRWVLTARNVLALVAARHGLGASLSGMNISAITVAGIYLDHERIASVSQEHGFALIALFPEKVTDTAWDGLVSLAGEDSIVLVGMTSVEADRFDRKKPQTFARLGDIKRKGFRAMAYRRLPGL
jgi:hypothetical protein